MAKVLIVYATRSGETAEIAKLIAEGIRFSGIEAKITNVTDVKKEEGGKMMGWKHKRK